MDTKNKIICLECVRNRRKAEDWKAIAMYRAKKIQELVFGKGKAITGKSDN